MYLTSFCILFYYNHDMIFRFLCVPKTTLEIGSNRFCQNITHYKSTPSFSKKTCCSQNNLHFSLNSALNFFEGNGNAVDPGNAVIKKLLLCCSFKTSVSKFVVGGFETVACSNRCPLFFFRTGWLDVNDFNASNEMTPSVPIPFGNFNDSNS